MDNDFSADKVRDELKRFEKKFNDDLEKINNSESGLRNDLEKINTYIDLAFIEACINSNSDNVDEYIKNCDEKIHNANINIKNLRNKNDFL